MPTKTRKRAVRQARVQEKTIPRPPSNPASQVLSGVDILDSCKKFPLEIPELPRNGKPGLVFIRQPSARAMIEIFGDEVATELREKIKSSREIRDLQMAKMIAGLTEDGNGNLLFTQAQAEQILESRYIVFQRLATAINASFRSVEEEIGVDAGDGGEGADPNPFDVTDSSDLPTV